MIRWLLVWFFLVTAAAAEGVRVDPDNSVVEDGWWSLQVTLRLDEVVPYRVFTLDEPRRLVIDFEGVTWEGVTPDQLLDKGRATGLRFGPLRPGWSRMVVDLAEPLTVTQAGLFSSDNGAELSIALEKATAEEYAAASGAPPDPGWDALAAVDPIGRVPGQASEVFTLVIDPGHGGIDPGANYGGVREADVMLLLAQEVAADINRIDGIRAVLTRTDDSFVSLNARLTIARAANVNLFISLHADALEEDEAQGASVYTLSRDGGDAASARIVERHERGDLLAGVDLTATGDGVATVLMDLARDKTGPSGRQFADLLVTWLQDSGANMNVRARRQGQFTVLTAADFPSVLVEAGFLSSSRDRAVLASVEGRAPLVQAIVAATRDWARQSAN